MGQAFLWHGVVGSTAQEWGLQAGCVLWSSLIPIFPATLLPVTFLSAVGGSCLLTHTSWLLIFNVTLVNN